MPPRRAAHTKMLWLKRESISHSKNKPRFSLHWSLIFFDATRARGENENELTRRKRIRFRTVCSQNRWERKFMNSSSRAEQLLRSGLFMVASYRHFPIIVHGLDATRNLSPTLPSLDCTGTGFDKRCADSAFDGLLMVALETMEAARFYDDTTASLASSNSRWHNRVLLFTERK